MDVGSKEAFLLAKIQTADGEEPVATAIWIPGKEIDPSAFTVNIGGVQTQIATAAVEPSGDMIHITWAQAGIGGTITALPGHPALIGKNGMQFGGAWDNG